MPYRHHHGVRTTLAAMLAEWALKAHADMRHRQLLLKGECASSALQSTTQPDIAVILGATVHTAADTCAVCFCLRLSFLPELSPSGPT